MDLVEEMVEKIALDLHGKTEIQVGENLINSKDLGKGIQCMSNRTFYGHQYF